MVSRQIGQKQMEVDLLAYSFIFLGGSKLATPYIYQEKKTFLYSIKTKVFLNKN